jgi:hypothetical protein
MGGAGRLRSGIDNNPTLRLIAESLDETAWRRLHRPPAYQPRTGARRARRDNTKQLIVKDREYLNLQVARQAPDHESGCS